VIRELNEKNSFWELKSRYSTMTVGSYEFKTQRTSMQGFNGGGGGGKVFLVVTAREILRLEIKT
jgi:hypothetical protein